MRPLLILPLLALVLLSGCADDPAPVVETAEAGPAPAPEPTVLTGSDTFAWDLALGVPTTGIDTQIGSSNAATIDVPEGAQKLTVTITWSCTPLPCDLHAYLDDPHAGTAFPPAASDHREHQMGPSPLTLTIEAPEAGEWWAAVHSDAPNAMVSGTFDYQIDVL